MAMLDISQVFDDKGVWFVGECIDGWTEDKKHCSGYAQVCAYSEKDDGKYTVLWPCVDWGDYVDKSDYGITWKCYRNRDDIENEPC